MIGVDARHVFFWAIRRLNAKWGRSIPGGPILNSLPQVVALELTNACDQRCPFCARSQMTRPVGFMEPALFRKVIDEVATYPYAVVRLMGLGECALHPEFREMIAYAAERRIALDVTTNGRIFDVMSPEEIVNSSIAILGVSIDGVDAASFAKLRVGGDYERLRRNVIAFAEARRRLGAHRPLFTVRNVLLSSDERRRDDMVAAFKAQWAEHCDRIKFNTLTPQKFHQVYCKAPRLCDDIFYNLHIEWDGSAPLCAYQHHITAQETVGDANTLSLAELWRAQRRREVRDAHLRCDFSKASFCKSCTAMQEQTKHYRSYARHNVNANRLQGALEKLAWRFIA
jgi:MoaA/NifB/PqqE/SkfB family radical SAM enzyme